MSEPPVVGLTGFDTGGVFVGRAELDTFGQWRVWMAGGGPSYVVVESRQKAANELVAYGAAVVRPRTELVVPKPVHGRPTP